MSRPEAVVFDNDGLLLDTESAWTRAQSGMFEQRGLEFTTEDKLALVGTPDEVAGQILEERLGEQGHAEELIEELHRSVNAELEQGVEAMPGANRLVKLLLEQGMPLGLVSNSRPGFIRRALEMAGFSGDEFRVLISGQEVPRPKPAPDAYLEACYRLQVTPGHHVVVLEDSPTGVAAARAAGLLVIGVPSIDGIDLSRAHHVVESLNDPKVGKLVGVVL